MLVRSRFNRPPSVGRNCSGHSRTKQEFAHECDLNNKIARVLKGDPSVATRSGFYADVSGLEDYQSCLNKVMAAEDLFMALPAKVRKRFANDPQAMIDFVGDSRNRSEAIDLGLIDAPSPSPASASEEASTSSPAEPKDP